MFLLRVCLCVLVVVVVVVVYTYWESASRLHWCPCVIDLKWAWFMLGPTEFPSWPLLLQTFQLVYTTRLERTVAKSSLCLQTVPQRSLERVQTDCVAGDSVTTSATSCWVIANSTSLFILLRVLFGWLVKHLQRRPVLVHVTWSEDKRTSAADQNCFSWCTMFVSGATEVNLASHAQETGSD